MSRILTTHVGSLPRPKELLEANAKRAQGAIGDEEYMQILTESAERVVAKQLDIGIDIVNEGEYGHEMKEEINYGPWWSYVFSRLSGLENISRERIEAALAKQPSDKVVMSEFDQRRDFQKFADVYATTSAGESTHQQEDTGASRFPAITGEIKYIGQEQVARDVKLLKDALAKHNHDTGFMAAVSPGSAVRLTNEYYEDQDAAVLASAPAMREEYQAITDAGLTVQIDAPDLAESWDQINPEPSLQGYQDFLKVRVDAINAAIEGLPREQTLLHVCWGSWHGPHSTDIPFADIIDVLWSATSAQCPSSLQARRTRTSGVCGRTARFLRGSRFTQGLSPTTSTRLKTRAWWRTGSTTSLRLSARTAWWPRRTVAWVAASTAIWRGQSWNRWSRGPRFLRASYLAKFVCPADPLTSAG